MTGPHGDIEHVGVYGRAVSAYDALTSRARLDNFRSLPMVLERGQGRSVLGRIARHAPVVTDERDPSFDVLSKSVRLVVERDGSRDARRVQQIRDEKRILEETVADGDALLLARLPG